MTDFQRGLWARPPRGLDFQRQYARKPARCQRITVSGLTIARASSMPGATRYNPANTRRSMLVKLSFFGDLRRSTLSWNNPTSANQIRLQTSLIRQSITRFDLTCQPNWVSDRHRGFGYFHGVS